MWELQCACVVSKATEDSGSNANSEHQGWCHQIKRFSDERNSLSSVLLWGIHIAGAGADFRSCISMPCPKAFIPSARDVGWNLAGFQAPHGARDTCWEAGQSTCRLLLMAVPRCWTNRSLVWTEVQNTPKHRHSSPPNTFQHTRIAGKSARTWQERYASSRTARNFIFKEANAKLARALSSQANRQARLAPKHLRAGLSRHPGVPRRDALGQGSCSIPHQSPHRWGTRSHLLCELLPTRYWGGEKWKWEN